MFHTKTNIDFLNLEKQMFLCTLGCAEVMTSCCLENNQGKSYHSASLEVKLASKVSHFCPLETNEFLFGNIK